jgi:hypothetical protein
MEVRGMEQINRQPIKLRKAYYRPTCKCYGTVVSVQGVPQYLDITDTSLNDLYTYLKEAESTTGLYIRGLDEAKVLVALEHKVPVTIKTDKVIPTHILEAMRGVPHCSLHVNINFIDDSVRKLLAPNASDIFDLREMMFLAKSWRITSVLHVDFMPHLMEEFDLYELLEIMKVYAPHILIHFRDIKYDEYLKNKSVWETVKPTALERFNEVYRLSMMDTAYVTNEYKSRFLPEFKEFSSSKKLRAEVIGDWSEQGDQIRHLKTFTEGYAFGMKPFFYKRVDNEFVEWDTIQESKPCEQCGKQRFV